VPVNKVTWKRVGGVKEPGRYMHTFGWVTITADDLAIWEMFPSAEFTLVFNQDQRTNIGWELLTCSLAEAPDLFKNHPFG
jgi:hypothetical protein